MCVVTMLTVSASEVSIMQTRLAPVRAAKISVWPGWGTPASRKASLCTGAVTTPPSRPVMAAWTAAVM
jgi:hypothetical protein